MSTSRNGGATAKNVAKGVQVVISSISGEFRTHQTTKEDGTVVTHRALLLKAPGLENDTLYFPISKLVALGSAVNPMFGLYWQAKLAEGNVEARKRIIMLAIAKHISYEATYVKHEAGQQDGDVVYTMDGWHAETECVKFDKALEEAIDKVCNVSLD